MAKERKVKEASFIEYLQERRDEILRLPKVSERWVVTEHTRAHEGFGYYPDQYPARSVHCGYFISEEDAQKWVDEHLPDDERYGKFVIRHEVLRTVTENRWFPY